MSNVESNLDSHYSVGEDLFVSLALFFPCFTGILAGANRMEALAKPFEAVPRGTVGAVVTSLFFYLALLILWGTAAHWSYLTGTACDDSDDVAGTNETGRRNLVAAGGPTCDWVGDLGWPHPLILQWGIAIASFSQALQCMVGAPRILQAIAADKLVFFLNKFANLRSNGEPDTALFMTGIIASLGALAGDISMVAPVLSMCFLHCYTAINLSVFVLDLVRAANWRPNFKRFHWSSALLGFLLCSVTMFMINIWTALFTLVMAFILYLYAVYSQTKAEWGSGLTGLRFRYALQLLYGLDRDRHELESIVNWRPQIIVLVRCCVIECLLFFFLLFLPTHTHTHTQTQVPNVDENRIAVLSDMIRNAKEDILELFEPSKYVKKKKRRMTAKILGWNKNRAPSGLEIKGHDPREEIDNFASDNDDESEEEQEKKTRKGLFTQASTLFRLTRTDTKKSSEFESLSSQKRMVNMLGEQNFDNYCLLSFVKQINKNGNGLCTLTSTVAKKSDDELIDDEGSDAGSVASVLKRRHKLFNQVERRERALDHMTAHLQMRAFSHAVSARTDLDGRVCSLQALKLGSLRPNTVIMNFPKPYRKEEDTFGLAKNGIGAIRFENGDRNAKKFVATLEEADATRHAVVVCKGIRNFGSSPQMPTNGDKFIDVWWIVHDGGLMLYVRTHFLFLT